jgi:hypothetical protein
MKMKIYTYLIPLIFSTNAFSEEIIVNLDQDISVVESQPDSNYTTYETYTWVGTNNTGARAESIYGFDFSSIVLPINDIVSITYNAFVPIRHGQGGNVHASLGLDNLWNEDTVTYASHGAMFGSIEDTQLLDNTNLYQYSSWDIDVDNFRESLTRSYSTIYLHTNTVGEDGTNFHDIAGFDYLNGAVAPYLQITLNEPAQGDDCTTKNRLVHLTTVGSGQNAATNKTLTVTFTGHITNSDSLLSGSKSRVALCSGTSVEYSADSSATNSICYVNHILSASSGTLSSGDGLFCTNEPDGNDKDKFIVTN